MKKIEELRKTEELKIDEPGEKLFVGYFQPDAEVYSGNIDFL